MTEQVRTVLLVFAFVVLCSREVRAQVDPSVTMRCENGGAVEISQDAVHVTCERLDLRIPASAIRNVTLGSAEPRVFIPLALSPAGGVAVPVGPHRHGVRLAVLGKDERERFLFVRVHQDDLPSGLSALYRLTSLPVFAEKPDDHVTGLGVPHVVGTYRLPAFSPEQRTAVQDLSARSAQVTDAGDVVVVYESGRSVVWDPATMAVRTLRAGEEGPLCQPAAQVIGVHQRTAAIFVCGRAIAYDLDSTAPLAEVSVQHPQGAALNGADNTLYWVWAGQLHRRSLKAGAPELPPIQLIDWFDRLAFSRRGDLFLVSRIAPPSRRRGLTDLHIYKFDQGNVGAAVRIAGLKGHDPFEIGIHPQSTRMATHSQNTIPFRKAGDIVTIWDLQPRPRKAVKVSDAKWTNIVPSPLRYSADGATIVATGMWTTFAIDAATGKLRCEVSTRIRAVTHLNAHGLSAGIASAGWQTGDLPRVMVWDSATCQIRGTLHADLQLLRSESDVAEAVKQP